MPLHAMGRPLSLVLRILFNEMKPYIDATNPITALMGIQIKLVKGIGTMIPPQKRNNVISPRRRLIIECLFVGEGGGSVSIVEMFYQQ